jgi:F0F1-type ATP synthase membrane subunit b/b'
MDEFVSTLVALFAFGVVAFVILIAIWFVIGKIVRTRRD